jgi:hypothetical protein
MTDNEKTERTRVREHVRRVLKNRNDQQWGLQASNENLPQLSSRLRRSA